MTRSITRMSIDDALHYTPEQRAAIIKSYPKHEQEARVKGLPSRGSGLIFPIAEEQITCKPFQMPTHWPRIGGVDFGWDHPFAATDCAWDREGDVWYVCKEYRKSEAITAVHAASIRPWGAWLPIAWPHDGLQHDKHSGQALAASFRDEGVNMLPEHATHEDGDNGVEAGLMDMLDRMETGRWKVFEQCTDWFGEFRNYHREDGKIVKKRDDLISASRYAYMMRRFAEAPPRSKSRSVGNTGSRYGFMG